MDYETILNTLDDGISPAVKDLFRKICVDFEKKKDQIIDLQNEVQYLKQKTNEIERHQSKDCIIFRNLPLVSNKTVTDDVIYFVNRVLGINMAVKDLVGCHELAQIKDHSRPPPIIAKFNNFDLKTRIWGRKKLLRNFLNPFNQNSVFMDERLTKVDKELYEYAKDQGFRVLSKNSKPQVLLKFDNNVQLHTIASKKDVDELAAKGLIIERNKTISKNPLKTSVIPNFKLPPFGLRQQYSMAPQATPKGVKRVISESPVHDASVLDQLKGMMGDDEQMLDSSSKGFWVIGHREKYPTT